MAQRKKPPPKAKKVNVSEKAKWKEILKTVDKDEIPIDLLLSIHVHLIDGTEISIDIKELLDEFKFSDTVETLIDQKLKNIDEYIKDIDFYVSIDDVAKTIQPITDRILKDL